MVKTNIYTGLRVLMSSLILIFNNPLKAVGDPVSVKMNPPVGKTLNYKETNKNVQMVNGDTTITTQTTFSSWYFPARRGDTILAEWVSNRVVHVKKTGFTEETIDTDESPEDQVLMYVLFKAMLGKKLLLKFSPDGNLYDIEGTETLMDSVMKALLARFPGKEEEMKKSISGMVNKSSFTTNLQRLFGFYPAKPVKQGSKWKRKSNSVAGFMTVKSDMRYQLSEINSNVLKIAQSGTSAITGKNTMTASGVNIKMEMNMKSTMSGNAVVLAGSNWIKSTLLQTVTTGKVNMDINGQKSVIKQLMATASSIELIED